MKPVYLFLFFMLHCISFSAFAADGVDNSYVDNGANELDIFVNNNSRAVLFGPGVHTAFGPPYFIVINNNSPAYDLGTVTQLSFTFCSSKMLSAYLDRVGSARFYYRIYLESQQGNPPPYSFVNLSSNNNLDPSTCYTSRQNNTWDAPLSVNVLNGLGSGSYFIEFYMEAQLDDVGDESMGCPVNAPAQCNNPVPHYGRVLRSRFNTTDPNACNYSTILNGQAPATRIKFYTGNQPPPLVLTTSATNVSCFGGTNGTASVGVSGGTTPYSYLWNNGQNTANISGLAAGTYTVTVTDASNSTATASATVSQPSVLSPNIAGFNVSCFGGTNGAINTSTTGGSPPYTYVWNNGQTTANISGLSAGTYTVTVTDLKSCTKTSSTTLTQPPVLVANTSSTNVSCFGGNNGTATASASGGSAPYTYLWSNGQTSASLTGLAAGTYTVTVTDLKSCTKTSSTTITQPPVLVANTSSTDVSCFGGNNGTATASASGGTAPYTYLWSNGATTSTITGLPAAVYNVTVTDANDCTATATATVDQPAALSVAGSGTDVGCFGGTNGSATATPTGGTAQYTYLWSNGETTSAISGLTAAAYSVTVTDANDCTATATATVDQPTALSVSGSGTDVSCFGGTNGTATAMPTGGTAPYTYSWSNGETTSTITGLPAAVYNVTVTDANDCTSTEEIILTEPITALNLEVNTVAESCIVGNDGSATVTANGGTGPYGYIWSNGQTTQSATALMAGNYAVTVTDDNMCTNTTTATVALGTAEDMKVRTKVKVLLQGPYVSAAGLMQDSLRAKGLIPFTEPYSAISGFTHVGGGGETMNQSVLDVTGPDAVVDWVFLELRAANMPSQVVATRSALLQRDGNVVDTDGQSPVVFNKEAGTSYYIVVRHRNHLGVQIGDPVLYPVCEAVETDFTELPEEDSYSYSGTNDAQRFAGNKHQMWAGNGRIDFQLKYNGSVNDRNAILNIVGINTPSNVVSGYLLADYNMDGQVKYNGSANDRNVLLGNIGISAPSNVLIDQTAH